MITRFRLEAEGENHEDVEEKLEAATQSMLGHLRATQPEDEWELTDDPTIPAVSSDGSGRAVIFGRRVYRRMENDNAY